MTLEEFMKHAADAAYLGDADLLGGHARELFGERDDAREEIKRLRDRVSELEHPMSFIPPGEERAKAVAAIYRARYEEAIEALKHVYHVCECRHGAIDAANMKAYAVLQKADRT